jgi:hypothetical protein
MQLSKAKDLEPKHRYMAPYKGGNGLYRRWTLGDWYMTVWQVESKKSGWANDVCFDNLNTRVIYDTKEEAMATQDKKLVEAGYVLCSQEQFDRLSVLV